MTYQIPLDDDLIVDNFAGGGGASTGIEMALGRPVNIAINHDRKAIAMHQANHPLTNHYCEDVWSVNPREICKGRRVRLAWFSPDCTHHSKARGKKPVSKKIRGLAWVAIRWAATVRPDIIFLENVEEFISWGPLVGDQPCPKRKGKTFKAFINGFKRLGYRVEWRELRACDYSAPTIRKRLFLIARSDGQPIVWPAATHGKGLLPYRTAAECIDWTVPCPSIFERKKPLAENTQRRIARGIKKFVIDAAKPFIVGAGGPSYSGEPRSIDQPYKTVTTRNHSNLTVPFLQHVQHASNPNGTMDITEPMRTIMASPKGGGMALVSPFISRQFGQSIGTKADDPLNTVVSKQKDALITAFIAKHYGGFYEGAGSDILKPFPTITARGTQNQVVTSHIMKMRGKNIGHPVDEPLHTISAQGTHHAEVRAFFIKYYGTAVGQEIGEPMHTITAKQRMGLITMAGEDYQIIDIGMRMLTPRELYRAQGFPDNYIIEYGIDMKGNKINLTKTDQVKMCGNSVSPLQAKALIEANVTRSALFQSRKKEKASA